MRAVFVVPSFPKSSPPPSNDRCHTFFLDVSYLAITGVSCFIRSRSAKKLRVVGHYWTSRFALCLIAREII